MLSNSSLKHLVLSIIFLSACNQANKPPASEDKDLAYASGEKHIPHRFLSPLDLQKNKKYPLLIFLHGAGERGEDNEKQLLHIAPQFANSNFLKKYPSYILFPQCPTDEYWANVNIDRKKKIWEPNFQSEPTDALQKVIHLIQTFKTRYPIDTDRIYVAGLSMGAFGVFELLSHNPENFAGGIAICGGADLSLAHRLKDIPLTIFHGAQDPIVPVRLSRGLNEKLNSIGGNHQYIEFSDGQHDIWNQAFEDPKLISWLYDQSLYQ